MKNTSDTALEIIPFQKKAKGLVRIPGSKSITNRCLLLSALAKGESFLRSGLISEDAELMMEALKKLGIEIEKQKGEWVVHGTGGKFFTEDNEIYLGNAGTAMRFLTAACTLANGNIRLFGKQRMHQRPIGDLIEALQQLGADVTPENKNACPPVIIAGNGELKGGECRISGKTSSQFISAILHIAPLTKEGVMIHILPPLVSRPYLEMTIELLKRFGIRTEKRSAYEYFIAPQEIHPVEMDIEADASSAAHVFSIAMAVQGEVTIENFPQQSIQGDVRFLEILERFGAQVSASETGTTIHMNKELQPLGEIDMEDMPDVALAAATLSALARGKSKITGLSTLRHKECDRIAAIEENLNKMGASVVSGPDFLEIEGSQNILHGAEIETHDDHRIAMSFAPLGTVIPGIVIQNPKCTEKTFPEYWQVFESLRA